MHVCWCVCVSFHISNGAMVGRINAFADRCKAGWKSSHGVMINYVYSAPSADASALTQQQRAERYSSKGGFTVTADQRVIDALAADSAKSITNSVQSVHLKL